MGPDGSDLKPIFGGDLGEMPGLPKGTTWYREPHWSRQSPDGKYFISYAFDHGIPVQSFLVPPRFFLHLGRMEGGPTRLITPTAASCLPGRPTRDGSRTAARCGGTRRPLLIPSNRQPSWWSPRSTVAVRTSSWIVPGSGSRSIGPRTGAGCSSLTCLPRSSRGRAAALFELDPVAEAGVNGDRSQPRRTAERDLGKAPEGGGLRVILPVSRLLGCSSARYSPDGEAIALIGSTLRLESEGMIDPSRFASSFGAQVARPERWNVALALPCA